VFPKVADSRALGACHQACDSAHKESRIDQSNDYSRHGVIATHLTDWDSDI
jgi:hypothetical protein